MIAAENGKILYFDKSTHPSISIVVLSGKVFTARKPLRLYYLIRLGCSSGSRGSLGASGGIVVGTISLGLSNCSFKSCTLEDNSK